MKLEFTPLLRYCLICCLIFVLPGLLFPDQVFSFTAELTGYVLSIFGGFYLWLGLGLVIFCFGLAVSPWGRIRLGAPEDKPSYSFWNWLAMLYSAGMGAGLLQRAVQEPIFYYQNPPMDTPMPQGEEILSLQYAYFHWGITAWAFYAAFGLVAAYYQYRKQEPALASVVLRPVIKKKRWGNVVNVLAVMTTIFGLVASVGLGSGQIAGGIGFLQGREYPAILTALIAILVGIVSFVSAMRGLDKGIKRISQFNMLGTLVLLIIFIFHNDVGELVVNFGKGLYYYFKDFIAMSLALGRYGENMQFVGDWTIFYWAFWLAWAPFTGLFIARISRGRTIRSFVFGVLLVPALGTFLWFTVFATPAFEIVKTFEATEMDSFSNIFDATFNFFAYYPFTAALSTGTVFLLCTYLVTSLDSAIYVVSMMTDKGNLLPGHSHKVFWGIMLPTVAVAAIWIGGDTLLRSMSNLLIVTALPFGFILVLIVVLFIRELKKLNR